MLNPFAFAIKCNLIMELTFITFTCFVYNSSEGYTGCVQWSRQEMGEREGVEILSVILAVCLPHFGELQC